MIIEPSWSTMRRSSCEGGEQKRCWKIWSTDSTVLGVNFRATAMWPRVRIVLVEIRLDSLRNQNKLYRSTEVTIGITSVKEKQLLFFIIIHNNAFLLKLQENQITSQQRTPPHTQVIHKVRFKYYVQNNCSTYKLWESKSQTSTCSYSKDWKEKLGISGLKDYTEACNITSKYCLQWPQACSCR